MKIEYKHHEETETTRAYTDIILNGETIGNYMLSSEELTVFVEINGEEYQDDYKGEDDLKINIKYFLEQC